MKKPWIFKLRRELVLKNCTTLLHEGNHSMLLKLLLIGKNFLKEFAIGGHLGDDMQKVLFYSFLSISENFSNLTSSLAFARR